MREDHDVFADSDEQFRITRRTALKVGGVGIAGAIVGFMPGRAAAAIRHKYALNTCSTVPSTTCGQGIVTCNGDPTCTCVTVYHKLQKVGATQTMCAQGSPGNFCGTCTGVACGQNGVPTGCNGNANCSCYQTPEGSGCGPGVPCYPRQACTVSSDCPTGSFCAINTCCGPGGLCIPTCPTGKPCPQGTECDSDHFCATPKSSCCSKPFCVAKCGSSATAPTRKSKRGKVRPARLSNAAYSRESRLKRQARKQRKLKKQTHQ